MSKFLICFGTRPELIKLAPIINEFKSRNKRDLLFVVNCHQHPDLLKSEILFFNIDIDYQFHFERDCSDLSRLNGILMTEFYKLKQHLAYLNIKTNFIIVQGDTATTFCASLFAFYEKIKLIHIEAGLRTNDYNHPFPEEFYRKTISSVASVHFTPTEESQSNLLNEGVAPDSIIITGNTVIDNLINHNSNDSDSNKDLVLITIHRRENIISNFNNISERIIKFCENHINLNFLWITHPNNSKENVIKTNPKNLQIIDSVSYSEMLNLYKKTGLIITDSGGIQEEASYLGIPVLLFRKKTERIESINCGISKYINDENIDLNIFINEHKLLNNNKFKTIFGKGNASKIIVDYLLNDNNKNSR